MKKKTLFPLKHIRSQILILENNMWTFDEKNLNIIEIPTKSSTV